MSEIVKELRERAEDVVNDPRARVAMRRAAHEIERLRAEIAERDERDLHAGIEQDLAD